MKLKQGQMIDESLALQLQICKHHAYQKNEEQVTAEADLPAKFKAAASAVIFSSLVSLAAVQLSDHFNPALTQASTPTVVIGDEADAGAHTGFGYRHMSSRAIDALSSHIAEKWRVSDEVALDIVSIADEVGLDADVDPIIILSIIAEESSFNVDAKSHVGAEGLMQVWRKWHPERFTGINKPTHAQNIMIGTAILKDYLERDRGNLASALQRYNGNRNDGQYRYATKVINTKLNFDNVYQSAQTRKFTRS